MSGLPSIYSHLNATGTGAGNTIEILTADGQPPHIQLFITNATVQVQGSADGINWGDYSAGGFSGNDSRKLIPGIRFWRTFITANSGSVTSVVGPVPTQTRGVKSVGFRTQSTSPIPG